MAIHNFQPPSHLSYLFPKVNALAVNDLQELGGLICVPHADTSILFHTGLLTWHQSVQSLVKYQ